MSNRIKKIFLTSSVKQTQNLAKKLSKEVLRKEKNKIIGLEGDLGGGKTTFIQGFAQGLGIKEKITSPTFVIMKRFSILAFKEGFNNFYHFDCYRIENPEELLSLGFEKIISNPKNIVVIEWADRVKKILPEDILWLKFEIKGENKRKIIVFKKRN